MLTIFDKNMSDFKVRVATKEDLPALIKFEQGVIKAERPYDPTLAAGKISYYDLNELLSSEDAQLIVVENEEQIIASGYSKKKKARHYLDHEFYAYLGFMFTHEDFRGQGVNSLIIDSLKKWSYTKGLTEIRLSVYENNDSAIRAYEKLGFKKHLIEMRIS